MPALFEITADILEAYDRLVDSDGEVSEENAGAMEALARVEAEKLDSYFYCIRKAEMEEAAAKAQMEQWKKKADSRRKAIDWLKAAVQAHLVATGQQKATTPNGNTFAVQKNGGKRTIKFKEGVVPENYAECAKIKYEWDMEIIRPCLEEGHVLPFATIEEPGYHLRLK